jgi:hypothetical protein
MRLSNYISAFFVPFFKHCASAAKRLMFRKNIPETITAIWRTLEAYLERLQIYAVQEPRNLHVGPVSYSLNGAWNNFGPMNKKFPYIVIM